MPKVYRRFIRIGGTLKPSPRFSTKEAADKWVLRMRDRKGLEKAGVDVTVDEEDVPTLMAFAGGALKERMDDYPANTWAGDERRLRNHILPELGHLKLSAITPKRIVKFLNTFQVSKTFGGKTVQAVPSENSKRLVKATLSFVFEAALDEEPPLISANPVKLIRDRRGRRKKKTKNMLPKSFLTTDEQTQSFIRAASEMKGPAPNAMYIEGRALAYAGLLIMAMPRKGEATALRWESVDLKAAKINFAWVYEQESKSLKKRTKKGEDEERIVSIPDALVFILKQWKESSPFSSDDDFVLCTPEGGHMNPSTIRQMHRRICKRANVKVTIHGLRHTGGRMWAARGGNLKVLQEVLGHSSFSTTEIYSKLQGAHLESSRNVLDMDMFGVSGSADRHRNDTTNKTQQRKTKRHRDVNK